MPKLFIMLILSAILFSYLGNVFSLASVNLAPNPGYSLIISKSYVVYTTIVSIFLFNSSLSAKNAFATLLIIIFSGLIMIQIKEIKRKSENRKWLIYSLGAFFAWGNLALASKYLINQRVPITVT